MKRKLFLIVFSLLSLSTFAQSNIEEVLSIMNEARTNPSLFLENRLLPYLKENPKEETSYAKSLIEDLKKRKPAEPLTLSPKLSSLSKGHAIDMGKKGVIGHNSSNGKTFEDRLRKKVKDGMIGENCDYGNDVPLDIVMALLIDDGIKSLGHRKNILNPRFHFIGIAIEPHKTYGTNCVMDFAELL